MEYCKFSACEYLVCITDCHCDVRGTLPGVCHKSTGHCLCKEGYTGQRCDQCTPGYHGYPDCRPCNCSEVGSSSTVCDASGKCTCLSNFAGRTCDQCSPGYYQYPECLCEYHLKFDFLYEEVQIFKEFLFINLLHVYCTKCINECSIEHFVSVYVCIFKSDFQNYPEF